MLRGIRFLKKLATFAAVLGVLLLVAALAKLPSFSVYGLLGVAGVGLVSLAGGILVGSTTLSDKRADGEKERESLDASLEELQQANQHNRLLLEDKAYLQFFQSDQKLERQLIARDLHDTVLANLVGLVMQLESNEQANGSPSSRETLDRTRAILEQTRSIMNRLAPVRLQEDGLVAAIGHLVGLAQQNVSEFTFSHDVEFTRLKPFRELQLYQIARELVDNIVRHSRAKAAEFSLTQQGDLLILTTRDDGCGFANDSVGGGGLKRVDDHVRDLSGRWQHRREEDQFTVIVVSVPLSACTIDC